MKIRPQEEGKKERGRKGERKKGREGWREAGLGVKFRREIRGTMRFPAR